MPQPVKVSDALIEAAREAAPLANRSIAAQVEHWAALGRSIEGSLTADQSMTLKRSVREPSATYSAPPLQLAETLTRAISQALTPGSRELHRADIASSTTPTYGTDPALPGYLIEQRPDGTRTLGKWVNGHFQALAPGKPKSLAPAPSVRTPKVRRARG